MTRSSPSRWYLLVAHSTKERRSAAGRPTHRTCAVSADHVESAELAGFACGSSRVLMIRRLKVIQVNSFSTEVGALEHPETGPALFAPSDAAGTR